MKRIFTLENGIRAVIVPFSRTTDVGISVAIAGGSAYEPAQYPGLSHLLEHIIGLHPRGYDSFTEFGLELDGLCTDDRAETDQRVMAFTYETTQRHFGQLMRVLANQLMRPTINRTMIEHEVSRVIEESHRDHDNKEMLVSDELHSALYKGSSSGRSVFGSTDTLLRVPIATVRSFHRNLIHGNKMTIAVSGNIEATLAEQAIRKTMSRIPSGSVPDELPTPIPSTQRIRIMKTPSRTAYVSIGFPIDTGFAHQNRFAISVINNHLYGRNSSRLFVRLIGERGYVYAVSTSLRHFAEQGRLLIECSVEADTMLEVLHVIFEELNMLREGVFSQEDLALAQNKLKQGARTRRYIPMVEAKFFAEQLLLTGEIMTSGQYAKAISSVRVRDIRRITADMFDTSRAAIVLAGPFSSKQQKSIRQFFTTP